MPDVVGLPLEGARRILAARGIGFAPVRLRRAPSTAASIVCFQFPAPGAAPARKPETPTLTGDGQLAWEHPGFENVLVVAEDCRVRLPPLEGRPVAEVERVLADARIRYGLYDARDDDFPSSLDGDWIRDWVACSEPGFGDLSVELLAQELAGTRPSGEAVEWWVDVAPTPSACNESNEQAEQEGDG